MVSAALNGTILIVEDALRLTKANNARNNLKKCDIWIDELIKQGLITFRSQFTEKEIRVETDINKDGIFVNADPDKLTQVIHNLLQNAVMYTERGGLVRIFTEQSTGEVKVIFANTGGELEEKDLAFIFERFFRGEKSRYREYGGSGIGLAIVKGMINAHDGQVGADIDDGETHVWFTLPIGSLLK